MKRILLQLVDGQPTAFASRGEVKEWWNRKGAEWEIGVKGRKAVGEGTRRNWRWRGLCRKGRSLETVQNRSHSCAGA